MAALFIFRKKLPPSQQQQLWQSIFLLDLEARRRLSLAYIFFPCKKILKKSACSLGLMVKWR